MEILKFKGQLHRAEGPGNWTHIMLPTGVATIFGSNGFISVRGKIDAYVFTGLKLTPTGNGVHRLSINEKIRKAIGKESGDFVELELEKELEKKEVVPPADFLSVLQGNETAMAFFEALTDSYKRYYTSWIMEARKKETRVSRIEKAVDRLSRKLKFHD